MILCIYNIKKNFAKAQEFNRRNRMILVSLEPMSTLQAPLKKQTKREKIVAILHVK
jgi:hypothetical protein